MVFNAIFNNISVISWWSVLLVEETGLSGENLGKNTASLICIFLFLTAIDLEIVKTLYGK
jgi:hypothetical protein